MSGGVLAAYLDQQQDPAPITVGRGAWTGFLTGVFGAVVWAVAAALVGAIMEPLQGQLEGAMTRTATDLPPEARRVLEWVTAHPAFVVTAGFVVRLFVGSIFATLGGVLGAAFFRNDVPPALGGTSEPPPFPPQ